VTARVAVLDHGSGNLHSVARALDHVGARSEVTSDPGALAGADALVIPGVGHFGACVRSLRERGLEDAVRAFVEAGRPVFGVCVGMQLLLQGSEEDAEPGLGVVPGRARRLPAGVKVPHMGWNDVRWTAPHPFVAGIPDGTRFYFVHSYAPDADPAVTVGTAEHGRLFGAALARGNVFATQFHPEKSGDAGLHVYDRFVAAAA